jgi:glutathione synthase/RimK-type ligase-like ATP-grasp enzyme
MRIALATCRDVPAWEQDDRPLVAALCDLGAMPRWVAWDDPAVDWSSFDACLIRTTWDYMERRDEFVGWAERTAARTPLFNPAAIVRWNTHKGYLRDLERRGAPVVPTAWCPSGARVDLADLLAQRGWTDLFIKPAVGATARETMRVTDAAQLPAAQRHLDRLLAGEDMMVQPYLPSVESLGEVSAVFVDGRFSHAVRKVPVPGDYRVQDDFGASDEPTTLAERELALAGSIMELVESELLYGRADFLRDAAGELRLTELELVEPSMFFRHAPHAARALAEALCRRL